MQSGDPATRASLDTFKTILLYDDVAWARVAHAAVSRVAFECGQTQTSVVPWRADLLEQTRLADAALAEAVDADLILLAPARMLFLPVWIRRWLDVWATCRTVPDAAVGLLVPPGVSDAVLRAELEPWARRNGLTWLGNLGPDGATEAEADAVAMNRDPAWRERALSPALREIMAGPAPYRFFGLNE
ncbi:MAG: hypothetical protein KatS3mg132_753 [Limisphaera sp.]|nr:MAG: hypothetical protein KatS3mg132_753 [Limisphaera sp.]